MAEITAYLSPNGDSLTHGEGPATSLKVATIEGVMTLRRDSAGAPWRLAERALEDLHIGSLLYEPTSGKLFAGAHENKGLWVSDDGQGAAWRQIEGTISGKHVYALARRVIDGRVKLLLGTQPVGVYESEDAGETWTEVPAILEVPDRDKWTFPGPPHIPHVKCFTIHPTDPDTYFVLVEQGGLFKTTDNGKSFREITDYENPGEEAYRDLHRLALNPDAPNEAMLATGEGVYRSSDGGEHWEHLLKRHGIIGYPDDLFFDPTDRNVVYVAGTVKSPGEWMRTNRADGVVYKTTNRGDSWEKKDRGLGDTGVSFEAMGQHIHSGGYMLTLGGSDGRVWTSEDKGESWTEVEAELPPVSKDHHYLPFLEQEERMKWLARRQERTGHVIRFGPPPGAHGGASGGPPPGVSGPR